MDGNCSPSLRSRPVRRSPFTREYSRRERARTASIVPIRLPCRSCPRRERTARTTLGWEQPTQVHISIFPFLLLAGRDRTRDALALSDATLSADLPTTIATSQ